MSLTFENERGFSQDPGGRAPASAPLKASVATLLDVLGWEIELAGARCIFLDALIGEMMLTVPPDQRERLVEGLQNVDLLAQHLTGLSAFARRLSLEAPTELSLDVGAGLGDITLGNLASRMQTALGGVEEDLYDDDGEAGDLDLF